ncbi:hypothetical protein R6Q59_029873 [Mikania micrantha]|uniref:Uncharacterized protein n=1 Tax=Mikania micrantha TaxID=192012 RepID=A0A5N6LSY8_9ASTR|nr:hypothetical protein E3N88_38036 [Mikania micrantha]
MKYKELTTFLLAILFALMLISSSSTRTHHDKTTIYAQSHQKKGEAADVETEKIGTTSPFDPPRGCWECWGGPGGRGP